MHFYVLVSRIYKPQHLLFIALKANYIKNKRDYRVCSPLLFEDVADLLDMPEL
jgi:hypothetical protein